MWKQDTRLVSVKLTEAERLRYGEEATLKHQASPTFEATRELRASLDVVEAVGEALELVRPGWLRRGIDALVARGLKVQLFDIDPRERNLVALEPDRQIYVWRMVLDLSRVDRLEVRFLNPDGTPRGIIGDVRFDGAANELLFACEKRLIVNEVRGQLGGEWQELVSGPVVLFEVDTTTGERRQTIGALSDSDSCARPERGGECTVYNPDGR